MDSKEAQNIWKTRVVTLNLRDDDPTLNEDCDCDCACPAQVVVEAKDPLLTESEEFNSLPTILVTMTLPQLSE